MAINRYMGISITSQNTKKRNISRARKTPHTPASVHSKFAWNRPGLNSISDQEETMAIRPSNRVRSSISRLSPSMAISSAMPKRGIQSILRCSNQLSPATGSGVTARLPGGRLATILSRYSRAASTVARAAQRGKLASMRSSCQAIMPPARSSRTSTSILMPRSSASRPATAPGRRPCWWHTSAAHRFAVPSVRGGPSG